MRSLFNVFLSSYCLSFRRKFIQIRSWGYWRGIRWTIWCIISARKTRSRVSSICMSSKIPSTKIREGKEAINTQFVWRQEKIGTIEKAEIKFFYRRFAIGERGAETINQNNNSSLPRLSLFILWFRTKICNKSDFLSEKTFPHDETFLLHWLNGSKIQFACSGSKTKKFIKQDRPVNSSTLLFVLLLLPSSLSRAIKAFSVIPFAFIWSFLLKLTFDSLAAKALQLNRKALLENFQQNRLIVV